MIAKHILLLLSAMTFQSPAQQTTASNNPHIPRSSSATDTRVKADSLDLLTTGGPERCVLVHLTADGLVTDCDAVGK